MLSLSLYAYIADLNSYEGRVRRIFDREVDFKGGNLPIEEQSR